LKNFAGKKKGCIFAADKKEKEMETLEIQNS